MKKTKRYILTGPPGSGKYTLIEALKKSGYSCMDEVSRSIIIDEQKKGGDGMPWENLTKFSRLVFNLTIKNFANDQGIVIHDRGLPDILAYLQHGKLEIPDYLTSFSFHHYYEPNVFYTPLWKEIYVKDAQRPTEIETAEVLDTVLQATYESLGFTLIKVPFNPPKKRAEFMANQLEIFKI